jgi:hypothetical protein
MTDGNQIAADVMEKGGAAVAIGSGIISFLMHIIGFMDHHSPAILSMCGIVGAVVSVKGHIDKARILTAEDARKQEEHNLKMQELRDQ